MRQNNGAAAVAGVNVYMQSIAKVIFAVVLGFFFMLLFTFKSFGQNVHKGQESKKGEMNFTEVAKHFKEHPQKLKRMKLENEEDEEKRPRPQPVSDPSLIRMRAAKRTQGTEQQAPSVGGGSGVPSGATPVATAPTALFEATLDNGTSIPPDTHGAVDSNYCVTAINTSVRIQTKAGVVLSTVTLNQFWLPVLSGGGSFDPRVHYDPYANRWFIVAVSGANSASSSVLIAVSKTSNPTSGWWMYKIIADPTATRWLDYPNVGFNKKWLTVTGNLFGSTYGGAKVFMFDKAALMSGSGAPYTSVVQSSSFTICPAFTYDNTQENLFAVESWNGGSGYMRLWKISGPVGAETMTTVSYPTTVNKWRNTGSSSDFAPQLGTTSKIQTNDDRVTQMVFMNNKLWFAHAVFLPYSTTTLPTRSSIQWWQTDTAGTPLQIGRIDDAVTGKFYAFPTMAVNTTDDAVIGFSELSASTYASAGYAVRMHTDPTDYIGPVTIYKAGGSSYYKTYGGSRNRWGDYSSTVLDPATNNFWTIQEVASATANVWDTWWANINVTGSTGCTVAAISGASSMCAGATTAFTDATTGGTWSSSNAAVATVNSAGTVTGVAAGTATITYAISGCSATKVISVNAAPSAGTLSGVSTVSTGSAITLTPSVTGGAWTSSNASIATVSSAGVVTGVVAGAVNISYAVSNSCGTGYAVKAITVSSSNIAPAFAGGSTQTLNVCQNASATSINSIMAITDGNSGQTETWTVVTAPAHGTLSGFTATATSSGATVTPTGMTYTPATGYSGTDVFTVQISDGYASATTTVNVNITALPSAGTISGASSVATGATTGLTTTVGGGSWTSSNTAVATVGATGIVSGVAAGAANITYTVSNSCGSAYAVKAITVTATTTNAAPAFTGGTSQTLSVCQGASATSINTKMAISDANTGQTETWTIVTAPAHGTLSGFSTTATSTGSTVTPVGLNYTPTAGYSGTDVFTVQVSDGYATATTTVNVNITALPSAGTVSGASSVTAGTTIALTTTVGGGTWASSNTSIATVGATGVVSGVAAGTANITYTVSNSCGSAYTTKAVTVTAATVANAAPVFSGGTSQTLTVCQNAAATSINAKLAVSDVNAGQTETWSVVSGPSHGTLTGLSTSATSTGGTLTPSGVNYTPATGYSGTDAFTVKISDGIASSTTVVNVTITPTANAGTISGPTAVAAGSTIALTTSGIAGGTWSSSSAGLATVDATTGVVLGVAGGNVVISYKVTNACGSSTATYKVRVSKSTTGHGAAAPEIVGGNDVLQPGVTVYPNPTHGQYNLVAPAAGKFYLFNIEGNLVATYNVTEGNNFLTFSNGIQPGVYIGKFSNEDGSITSSVRISYEQ